jgi:hypothetical protein
VGAFDEYIPDPPLSCPHCGELIPRWQGKDGPCDQLVWRQGVLEPVDQAVDPQWRLPPYALAAHRLPRLFLIYPAAECRCSLRYAAIAEADTQGRWVSSRVVSTDEARDFFEPNWRT